MKMPEAIAAVDKWWEKLHNLPAWDVKRANRKADVVKQAQKGKKPVQVARESLSSEARGACQAPPTVKGKAVLPGERQRRQRVRGLDFHHFVLGFSRFPDTARVLAALCSLSRNRQKPAWAQ